jgi:hypothetical protein
MPKKLPIYVAETFSFFLLPKWILEKKKIFSTQVPNLKKVLPYLKPPQ